LQFATDHFGAVCFIASWRLGGDLQCRDQQMGQLQNLMLLILLIKLVPLA
jgi:hypothetical protein